MTPAGWIFMSGSWLILLVLLVLCLAKTLRNN
jgi:hypothetical protein